MLNRRGNLPPFDRPVAPNRASMQYSGLLIWLPAAPIFPGPVRSVIYPTLEATTVTDMSMAQVGEIGHAFAFDGTSSYMRIPDSALLDTMEGTDGGTCSFWLRPGSTLATGVGKGFIDSRPSAVGALQIYVWVDQSWRFGIGGETPPFLQAPNWANEWHLVTMTWSKKVAPVFTGYWDGAQVTQWTATGTIIFDLMDIGRLNTALYFAKHMSDIRFYRRALSPAEVFQLYDPATRWELYAPVPRLWAVPEIAAAAGNPLLHLMQQSSFRGGSL